MLLNFSADNILKYLGDNLHEMSMYIVLEK